MRDRDGQDVSLAPYAGIIREILKAVIASGKAIELNTCKYCKTDGTRVSGGTTTALPADILSSVKGFGLGSYASKVKFTNITWTAE